MRQLAVAVCLCGISNSAHAQADEDGLPGKPILPSYILNTSFPGPKAAGKVAKRAGKVAKRAGKFIGLKGILDDPHADRGRAVELPNLRGTQAGTWLGFWGNKPLEITDAVGRFASREDAIRAGQRHPGAAILLTNPDGSYDVYGLDGNRSTDMTLDNVEQVDGYSVTDLSTKDSQVDDRFGGLVTEDGSVLKRPGRFSGGRYTVDRDATVGVWTAERAADEIHRALGGAWDGTDEARLYEALAQIPKDDRAGFPALFSARHGGDDLNAMLDGDLNDITTDRILARDMLAATAPIYSAQELQHDMRKARRAYPGRRTNSASVFDTKALTSYLGNFAATNPESINQRFRTGKEYALKKAIEAERERLGRRLSPGEVFGQALRLNGGDSYKAVLTAHNTLRATARGLDDKLNEQVPDKPWLERDKLGLQSDTEWMRRNLQPIRGGKDESGAWYHLFGVATMSMVGGETAATGMSYGEEYLISGDANTDPIELYIDLLGVDLGTEAAR